MPAASARADRGRAIEDQHAAGLDGHHGGAAGRRGVQRVGADGRGVEAEVVRRAPSPFTTTAPGPLSVVPRRIVSVVPSIASTALTAPRRTTTVWPTLASASGGRPRARAGRRLHSASVGVRPSRPAARAPASHRGRDAGRAARSPKPVERGDDRAARCCRRAGRRPGSPWSRGRRSVSAAAEQIAPSRTCRRTACRHASSRRQRRQHRAHRLQARGDHDVGPPSRLAGAGKRERDDRAIPAGAPRPPSAPAAGRRRTSDRARASPR